MNKPGIYCAIEILLVEDNPNDAELALRAVSKHNLANKIHWVKDGEEALEFLLANGNYSDRDRAPNPRVVFLDLKLPKVDGLEVLRQIRASEKTKLVPVVVLTSSKEERDIIESYELGVNSYIVKPVNFDKFLETVNELGLYWMLYNEPPPG